MFVSTAPGQDGCNYGEGAGKGRACVGLKEAGVADRHPDHGTHTGAGAAKSQTVNPEIQGKIFIKTYCVQIIQMLIVIRLI